VRRRLERGERQPLLASLDAEGRDAGIGRRADQLRLVVPRWQREMRYPSRRACTEAFSCALPSYNGGMAKPFQFRLRTLLMPLVGQNLVRLIGLAACVVSASMLGLVVGSMVGDVAVGPMPMNVDRREWGQMRASILMPYIFLGLIIGGFWGWLVFSVAFPNRKPPKDR
jgi:hypothetical protein